jgi:hypothetical protein
MRNKPKAAGELEKKIKAHLIILGGVFVVADDAEDKISHDEI